MAGKKTVNTKLASLVFLALLIVALMAGCSRLMGLVNKPAVY